MKVLRLSIALLVGLGSFVYADDIKAKTVIIFDASNSMWGQINKKAKIDTAKETLEQLVKNWDSKTQGELGITVYGHRKAKDCNDIEAIIPLGTVKDKNKIFNIINKIQPKGKTPISASLEKVAAELRGNDGISSIILISDGKDSCDADPCETVKKLKKEGMNFQAYVLAFDVKGDAQQQLSCIAKESNGSIINVNKPEDLPKAMAKIQKKIELATIKNTSIISQDSGTQITATYQFFTMNNSGEADEKLQQECTSSASEPCALDLKKGKYLILATSGSKKGEALITIDKDRAFKEDEIEKIIVDLK